MPISPHITPSGALSLSFFPSSSSPHPTNVKNLEHPEDWREVQAEDHVGTTSTGKGDYSDSIPNIVHSRPLIHFPGNNFILHKGRY